MCFNTKQNESLKCFVMFREMARGVSERWRIYSVNVFTASLINKHRDFMLNSFFYVSTNVDLILSYGNIIGTTITRYTRV